ncbi:hypothetical protein SEHO0A_04383 [Salmonella enterica subsp. houtenae str. ATCC BAA-1581]|nr:hypothetical protein SEHO0A_04383 [Salmonella enterica subsp. houtenae str. ATCC BAA-1581]ENZ84359.1 hypothetical protein D088_730015 [Salmonella enterica subsp. houtenae serovar 16:z4,z32:-- str. RKS3027]
MKLKTAHGAVIIENNVNRPGVSIFDLTQIPWFVINVIAFLIALL